MQVACAATMWRILPVRPFRRHAACNLPPGLSISSVMFNAKRISLGGHPKAAWPGGIYEWIGLSLLSAGYSADREHSPERSDGLASQFIPSESRFSLF